MGGSACHQIRLRGTGERQFQNGIVGRWVGESVFQGVGVRVPQCYDSTKGHGQNTSVWRESRSTSATNVPIETHRSAVPGILRCSLRLFTNNTELNSSFPSLPQLELVICRASYHPWFKRMCHHDVDGLLVGCSDFGVEHALLRDEVTMPKPEVRFLRGARAEQLATIHGHQSVIVGHEHNMIHTRVSGGNVTVASCVVDLHCERTYVSSSLCVVELQCPRLAVHHQSAL
mmetsp:Transcript_22683/g.56903  ORF Transcript_22683/g.56903 Transcript_22683/m.56903 type:complete len:230 (+) Transcript_22683:1161-1850(+)